MTFLSKREMTAEIKNYSAATYYLNHIKKLVIGKNNKYCGKKFDSFGKIDQIGNDIQ